MSKTHKYLKKSGGDSRKPRRILTGVFIAALALFLIVLLLVLFRLGKKQEAPVETVPTTETTAPTETEAETAPTTEETTVPTEPEPQMLPEMAELYRENPDVIGWLNIEDTRIDYPVMYAPEEYGKYLHRNFEGNYSIGGLPFVSEDCSFDPESDNIMIFGHNMNNGTQFRDLVRYEQKNYWQAHPTITFKTLYEERTYEVFAAFRDRVYYNYEDVFKFYQFIDVEDEAHFNEAMSAFKSKGTYDTGITPEYGDHFLMLITCAYHVDDGRYVVVARQVKEDSTE